MNTNQIKNAQIKLTNHPLFAAIKTPAHLKIFMEYHVFAVWDFMSLLKSLQNKLTCTEVPWRPSKYSPKIVRLINEIVVGEECDVNPNSEGKYLDHFSLYLQGMQEIGANTSLIRDFISGADLSLIPYGARNFVKQNLDIAVNGSVVEVATTFFYGREKIIPDMFQSIVDQLKKENIFCPRLTYYLERHIEVDGHEHGHMAEECLELLSRVHSEISSDDISRFAMSALSYRHQLWDEVLKKIH